MYSPNLRSHLFRRNRCGYRNDPTGTCQQECGLGCNKIHSRVNFVNKYHDGVNQMDALELLINRRSASRLLNPRQRVNNCKTSCVRVCVPGP